MRRLAAPLTTLLAVLPLAVEALAKLVLWRRPFFVQFYDPEGVYFYQGLRLLRGEVPTNVDHPGTPLQLLTAVVASFTGPSILRFDVFVAVAHWLIFALHFVAAIVLLRTVLRDAPPMLAIASVWTYLLAPAALEKTDVWTAEAMYFVLASIVLALLWRWWRAPSPRGALILGAAIGIAIATKILLLAWAGGAFVAVAMSRRGRDLVALCGGMIAGLMIGTLPVASKWAFMIGRLHTLSSLDPQETSFMVLLTTGKGWLLWLTVLIVFAALRARRETAPLLAFAGVAFVLCWGAVIPNPSFLYLLPTAAAAVVLLAAGAQARPAPPRAAQVGILAICGLLLAKSIHADIGAHRRRIDDGERIRAAIARIIPRDAIVVYSWRAPVPSFALRITTGSEEHALVATRYPREGHYTKWLRTVSLPPRATQWDYLVIQAEDLPAFPEPVGPVVASVAPYLIHRAP